MEQHSKAKDKNTLLIDVNPVLHQSIQLNSAASEAAPVQFVSHKQEEGYANIWTAEGAIDNGTPTFASGSHHLKDQHRWNVQACWSKAGLGSQKLRPQLRQMPYCRHGPIITANAGTLLSYVILQNSGIGWKIRKRTKLSWCHQQHTHVYLASGVSSNRVNSRVGTLTSRDLFHTLDHVLCAAVYDFIRTAQPTSAASHTGQLMITQSIYLPPVAPGHTAGASLVAGGTVGRLGTPDVLQLLLLLAATDDVDRLHSDAGSILNDLAPKC